MLLLQNWTPRADFRDQLLQQVSIGIQCLAVGLLRLAFLGEGCEDPFCNLPGRKLLIGMCREKVENRFAKIKRHDVFPFESLGHGLQQRIFGIGIKLDVDLGGHVV